MPALPARAAGGAGRARTLGQDHGGQRPGSGPTSPWRSSTKASSTKGAIVNIASINSFVVGNGTGSYPVSKGALSPSSRALAAELALDGVRVNALAPGLIETAMTEPTRSDPRRLGAFLNHVPMRRVGQPEELAGPVVFLRRDAASYVTGAILAVDGGFLAV